MSYPPSMVHKSGDQLVVRSVVSGNKLFGTSEYDDEMDASNFVGTVPDENHVTESTSIENYPIEQDEDLPQCKVKRNYACSSCSYYTQNPRYYLHHLKNVHKEKIRIYECPHCLYASKHSQKLQRHIHMVHVMGKRKMLIKAKTTSATSKSTNAIVMKKEKPANESSDLGPFEPLEEPKMDDEANFSTMSLNTEPESSSICMPSSSETEARIEESIEAEGEIHRDQPLKCSQCSFSSRNPNLVTRHERLVHLKKKFYRCTKCDYITHMKARFTKHVKYHSMPMIKCEMCDFRTPYKWNLDRHNKNHFANGAFKCSQCNFTADIKQSLTVHEMNHHVPPISQNGANGQPLPLPTKRRCRVGASDIMCQQETASAAEADLDDLELLRMERESLAPLSAEDDNAEEESITSDETSQVAAVEITMVKPNLSPATGGKTLNLKNPTAAAYLNGTLKPEDVILTKNGSVYVKKFKCRVCQYKAAWESEMIRHEVRVHGLDSAAAKKKPLPRPIPNLIPIQNNGGSGSNNGGSASSSTAASPSRSATSTPTGVSSSKSKSNAAKMAGSSPLKNGNILSGGLMLADSEYDKPLTEKDLNEIYTKSCATSSLKDFASLIGTEESTIKSEEKEQPKKAPEMVEAKTSIDPDTQSESKKLPDAFKKKNASFFDRLKEKLMVGAGESHNLSCWCGHQSKCLSESVLHQKTHSESVAEKNDKSLNNGPLISGADLKSTRCQHCRQRCKTSSDLFAHLQSCPEMNKKESHHSYPMNVPQQNGDLETSMNDMDDMPADEEPMDDEPADLEEFSESQDMDKQTNKVFVWNSFLQDKDDGCDDYADEDFRSKSPASESSLVGYEIAPGIGSVMPSTNEEASDGFKEMNIDVHNVETTTKKVFKCPTCTFWASTASRFHVHVVSHMNVKPFGCSVCPYQSKWKWDVTKHIKLKKERDPAHERAEMRTIDVETGRRNYTKYNRFLTIMRVHEPRLDLTQSTVKPPTIAPAPTLTNSNSVPVLPRLTPAPSINGDVDAASAGNANNSAGDGDIMMRPLPQLHPANPSVAVKRPHESSNPDDGETPKKKMSGEKKMWKCKKCKFRNTDRNIVLAHVKEHYTSNSQNANNSHNFSASDKAPSNVDATDAMNGENHTSVNGIIRCNLCNFETDNQATFRIHNSHHVEDPSAAFKCCFCPFFANDKQFMINHISTHGVNNPEELVLNALNNEDSYRREDEGDKTETSADELAAGELSDSKLDSGAGDEMEIYKRFKCANCPYVTNNKSQYLYHKQFHRLRDAPFKCNICSYNVTKRHLLHQHLKIHGVKRAQFKNCLKAAVENKSAEEDGMKLNTDIDTAHLPDVPLVWVHKAGVLTKMFKCRHCPHVNLRKSNIHEHEKMHFDRIQRSPNGTITTGQVSTHHCVDCNYVCNNAGALASHAKVHQGAFGQICALADSRRSDESQIREITRLFKEDDRFKKEVPPKTESLEKRLMPLIMDSPSSPSGGADTPATVEHSTPVPPPPILLSQDKTASAENKMMHFCSVCPARFYFLKDLESHSRFHSIHHTFKCSSCTYSAPMQAQLLAHKRVHSNEYHEKTNSMCQIYPISKDFPRPRTANIPEKPGFAGLGWVVVHPTQKKEETPPGIKTAKTVSKQFSCHKCPAQFFKSVALQHHLTLHGGKDQFQCRGCDYRVKTYGNLIKHEAVHGLEPRLKAKVLKSKKINFTSAGAIPPLSSGMNASIPCSGTELFQHRSEQMMKERTTSTESTPTAPHPPIFTPTPPSAAAIAAAGLSADPEFGIFMHGSPDFIYPQTVKNGKLKEKRYKCHKCPSAFEKREQYKTHCTLHGAKSRFRCEKCDYSVKYFANYTQHMRKHEMNERFQMERRASVQSKAGSEESSHEKIVADYAAPGSLLSRLIMNDDCASESYSSTIASPEKLSYGTPMGTPPKAAKTLHISVADQQAVVLMQEKISDFGINVTDQLHRCYYCPYSHQRKDAVENHERCHFNPKGSYVCEFCNYTVPQPHFLREHQKLHFGTMKGVKPEAYMKCDRLEIWMETEEGKVCIFKDTGRKENRFEPPVTVNEEDSEFKKMYVDVITGEEFTPCKDEPPPAENNETNCSSPALPKPVFDSLSKPVSPALSLDSCPTPSKEDELTEVKSEIASVKDEPIDPEDETKMDAEDEEYLKMMDDDVGDDPEDVDEEEDVERVDNDEDVVDENIESSTNPFEMYDSDDEGSDDADDEVEMADVDQTANDENPDHEELPDRQEECENLDEDRTQVQIEEPSTETATSTLNESKVASDDSDSEDSESSSSSSSSSGSGSGSDSSCSSSDSSDDEKDQNPMDEENEIADSIEKETISEG